MVAVAPQRIARTHRADFLEHAQQIEREHPEYLASVGMTAGEFASGMADSRSLEESVAAGWISAAEQRFIEARATREDLIELGHTPEEIEAILAV